MDAKQILTLIKKDMLPSGRKINESLEPIMEADDLIRKFLDPNSSVAKFGQEHAEKFNALFPEAQSHALNVLGVIDKIKAKGMRLERFGAKHPKGFNADSPHLHLEYEGRGNRAEVKVYRPSEYHPGGNSTLSLRMDNDRRAFVHVGISHDDNKALKMAHDHLETGNAPKRSDRWS